MSSYSYCYCYFDKFCSLCKRFFRLFWVFQGVVSVNMGMRVIIMDCECFYVKISFIICNCSFIFYCHWIYFSFIFVQICLVSSHKNHPIPSQNVYYCYNSYYILSSYSHFSTINPNNCCYYCYSLFLYVNLFFCLCHCVDALLSDFVRLLMKYWLKLTIFLSFLPCFKY